MSINKNDIKHLLAKQNIYIPEDDYEFWQLAAIMIIASAETSPHMKNEAKTILDELNINFKDSKSKSNNL